MFYEYIQRVARMKCNVIRGIAVTKSGITVFKIQDATKNLV
jgi:hypothetical protein